MEKRNRHFLCKTEDIYYEKLFITANYQGDENQNDYIPCHISDKNNTKRIKILKMLSGIL